MLDRVAGIADEGPQELPAPQTDASAALLELTARQLAACDLDLPLAGDAAGLDVAGRLSAGFGNLSEAIRQAVDFATRIADEIPGLATENDELSAQSVRQADLVGALGERAAGLLRALASAQGELRRLGELTADAQHRATLGRQAAQTLTDTMTQVRARAARIDEVIEVVDQVAFQTNILSINASIEAARAGQLGRGFAVVAGEVRSLAARAAGAARDARGLIGQTQEAVAAGDKAAATTVQTINELGVLVEQAGAAMAQVADSVAAQEREVTAIDRTLSEVAELSRRNVARAESVSARSAELKVDAGMLSDCVALFRLPPDPLRHPRHAFVHDAARDAAAAVGAAFQRALQSRAITADALFSREYAPIPGTDPVKHRTAFDAFCDEVLPALQEPIAAAQPWIVFAISANVDGYVPTHNDRFCKPLTGHRATDLVGNRTKRVFGDRVGRTVGAHTDPYRLQVYRRDTGEIMFDLSVPILVAGRHWGGFRIGYSLA